ncbi:hypothetical protein Q5693_09655 [Enterococcus faecium]
MQNVKELSTKEIKQTSGMQNVKELSTKEIKQTSGGGGAGKNLIYGMGYGYLRSCNRL